MKSPLILLMIFLSAGAEISAIQNTAAGQPSGSGDSCYNWEDIERMKNKKSAVFGFLRKFTPWESGKGAGHMFWQWEIVLYSSQRIPVIAKPPAIIPFEKYADSEVIIYGKIYYGIIIGDDNPNHQSMTGYRIDADSIFVDYVEPVYHDLQELKITASDTCWVYPDIEDHPNTGAVVAGKIIEYIPPKDGSKLGDEKIWDYELVMQDGNKIPLYKTNGAELSGFSNKDVFLKCYIKYGIIFGSENTANMTGYRLDPIEARINDIGYGNTLIEGKIRIDLTKFNDEGYRVQPDGEKSATSYEFCIPANDSVLAEVKAIDPAAGEMKGSKGRSGCSDQEWLVISSTRKAGFKEIIRKLAELKYIRKITETFWE